MSVTLYPHQKKAINELSNGKILWGGVGTGKTLTALMYYYLKVLGGKEGELGPSKNPVDLYVITTAKKRDSLDWDREALKLGVSNQRDLSVTGAQLVVDSWNNIDKYKDVENAFFIFDEQRLVGKGAWTKAFLKIAKHNRWILLSATPGDTWLDYIPVFIANGLYKNRTAFIREHVVYSPYAKFPKVESYLGTGKLIKHRNDILVAMPYQRHTTRHLKVVPVAYDQELYNKVVKDRWHVYEDRPLLNVGELFNAMRKVVNSDISRIEMIRELMENHPRLIVFYSFDYELAMLKTICTPNVDLSQISWDSMGNTTALQDATVWRSEKGMNDVQVAEWNGHKHEAVPDSERWVYLVQYVAGAEAWDCVSTNAVVFYSLTYSYKNFEQAQGRIDRLNTPFANLYYYILLSGSSIDKAVYTALVNKRNFNERDFADNT